ncbi:methyltransferase domain-containing protein [Ferrovibrio sp.]|uniref:class I SAM-dependent DNA methyltransferase n=1 Tax=Ferrovibrio sp. TaxID=1917215 RepID=UPI003D2E1628
MSAETPEDAALLWEQRGIAARDAKRYDEAIGYFRAGLALAERPISWLGLALCLARTGRHDDARTCLEKARTLAPHSGVIRHLADAAAGANPARMPSAYIAWLYNTNAADFDNEMAALAYRGPEMLHQLVTRIWQPENKLAILDLGCGTGFSGQPFKPYAATMDGVDIAQRMLDQAARCGNYTRLFCADAHVFLRQADQQYDGILAAEMLNYVGDVTEIFTLMAAALKPDGQIFITIERDQTPTALGYRLAASGRYQHDEKHIPVVAAQAGLMVADRVDEPLRVEAGELVPGMAYRLCHKI